MGPILNVGQPVVDPQVTFTPEELSKSMQKYRKELILMPMFAMSAALQHMGHRDGIRYKEHLHEMKGNFEFGNYDKYRRETAPFLLSSAHWKPSLATASSLSTPTASYRHCGVATLPRARP